MTIRARNACILFLIFTNLVFACLAPHIMALEVETHRAINESIGQGPFLDDYLKIQLCLKNGKDTFINNKLNFRTRLNEFMYLFFNNKRRYFAMQVATVPHKLAAAL